MKEHWKIGTTAGCVVTDVKATAEDLRRGAGDTAYYGGVLICESIRNVETAKLIAMAPEMLRALDKINKIIFAAGLSLGSDEYFEVRALCTDITNQFEDIE